MTDVIKIEGLTELRDLLLRQLPENLQGKALQGALALGAKPILSDAKARAPVSSGKLKRAIYSARARASTKTNEIRIIGVRSGKRFQKSNRDAFYWRWIEFGRAAVKTRKAKVLGTPTKGWFGKETAAFPARPFMRPAFESRKLEALNIIKDSLKGQIEKVALKAQAKSVNRLLVGARRTFLGF